MKNQPVEILLIEDNPDHVEIILDALRNNGVENDVMVLTDGQIALDYLFRREPYQKVSRPGLILLDINLPKIDGIEVLREIKQEPHLRLIPVIMLTTSDNDKDIIASYGNGANSYVVKPIDFEKFQQAIKELKMYWLLCNRLP
jgi:two-component system, response regulator